MSAEVKNLDTQSWTLGPKRLNVSLPLKTYARKENIEKSTLLKPVKAVNRVYLGAAQSVWEQEKEKWTVNIGVKNTTLSDEQFALHLLKSYQINCVCKSDRAINARLISSPIKPTHVQVDHATSSSKRKRMIEMEENCTEKKLKTEMKIDLFSMLFKYSHIDDSSLRFLNKKIDICIEVLRGIVLEQSKNADSNNDKSDKQIIKFTGNTNPGSNGSQTSNMPFLYKAVPNRSSQIANVPNQNVQITSPNINLPNIIPENLQHIEIPAVNINLSNRSINSKLFTQKGIKFLNLTGNSIKLPVINLKRIDTKMPIMHSND